jgi:DNA-binding IclR family transcriptional regulator
LESFSEELPEQTFATIVATTGLPAATAHRYLGDLVAWGGLDRTSRGHYRIGTRLWQLGALAPQERRLRDVALPFLEDLREATRETIHLAVLDGDRTLFVEKLQGRPNRAVTSQVGRRAPLHATGPGKVLLAYSSPAFIDEVLAGPLPKMAARTLTDPTAIRRALRRIRAEGTALSRDEMTDGTSSAAAPVFGPEGEVVAAISVAIPTAASAHLAVLAKSVRVAAAGITRGLRSPARRLDRVPQRSTIPDGASSR